MARHLSPEEIELLSGYKLTGGAFAQALIHLESCDECRNLLPSPSKAELIERLLSNDPPPKNKITPSVRYKLFKRKWRRGINRLKRILHKKDSR